MYKSYGRTVKGWYIHKVFESLKGHNGLFPSCPELRGDIS